MTPDELRRLADELECFYNETLDADVPEDERKRRKGLRAPLATDRCALRSVCCTLDLYEGRLKTITDERARLDAEQAKIEEHRKWLLRAADGWGERIRAQLNPPKTEGA